MPNKVITMKVLLVLLVAHLATTIAQNEKLATRCCSSDENKIINNKCVRDKSGKSSNISLACESKYVLEPHNFEEDEFNVTDDGSLEVRGYEGLISPHE